MPLTTDELAIVTELEFDQDLVEVFKREANGQLFGFKNADRSWIGLATTVNGGGGAEKLMKRVEPQLFPKGYRSAWTTPHEENGLRIGDAVAMLHSTDHFAILDAAAPRAEDHAGPEVIRDKLKAYETLCEFEIVGAASDWVAVTFMTLPADVCGFAEDIYLFCPDSCDLNSGVGEKVTAEDRSAAERICPAFSETFQKRVRNRFDMDANFEGVPPELLAMMPSPEALTEDAQWSVRLLARKVQREMYFFFWWD